MGETGRAIHCQERAGIVEYRDTFLVRVEIPVEGHADFGSELNRRAQHGWNKAQQDPKIGMHFFKKCGVRKEQQPDDGKSLVSGWERSILCISNRPCTKK